ncbi:MAG TPA: AsmA family protein [Caldimonas sp.]|nr:AsmA family protein [Caldimonas sp.]HEX2539984.1 AsmA family protein [Caldimonas sp.]
MAGWLLLALVVVGAVVVATHPWWLGPAASRYLTATSGRPVHFDSIRLGIGPQLAPRLAMRGVRIANAPWSESTRPFADFEEVDFEFTGRRSEGRWVISRVRLKNGEVNLERRPDGLRNWRLRRPDDRGLGRYWFTVLEAERTSLTFVNRGIDLVLRAKSSPADAAAEQARDAAAALPSRVDFDGSYRRVDFRGSTLTGAAISLLKSGAWFPLRGHAEVEGARIELDGRAADLLLQPRIEARMLLAGRSLATLGPWIGERYRTAKALRAVGQLSVAPGRLALADATARIGATDLAGSVEWTRDEQKHRLRAELRSDSTDAADLAWIAGRAAPAAARAASAVRPVLRAASAVPAPAASAPNGTPRLRGWDAQLSFAARRLHVADARPVQSLTLQAKLLDGVLEVSSIDLGVAGGHATGSVKADLRDELPAGEARLAWRGVRLESLLPAQDPTRRLSGALQGRAVLTAKGSGLDEMLASVAGNASFRLADGTIPSMLDAKMGLQAGKVVRTFLGGNEPLPLPCAAANVDIAAGRARIRSLVIDSANTRTTGSGGVHFGQRTIDLVLTPTAKKPGLLDMGKSIRLYGRLDKPERELVDRVGQDAGGGAC